MAVLSLSNLLNNIEDMRTVEREHQEQPGYISEALDDIDNGGFGFNKTRKKTKGTLGISLADIDNQRMFNITEDCINTLATAFTINRVVSQLAIDVMQESVMVEVAGIQKNVIRGGQIVTKIDCPEGYKSSNGKCVKMNPLEVRKRVKAAKLASKTRMRKGAGAAKMAMKMRAKSMKVRDRKESVVNKTKTVS
jgi:hypothetical protein